MSDWVDAVVSAGSGVLGALVGAGVALWVYRASERSRQRAELVGALQAFATAMDLLVAELRRMAPPRPWLARVSRGLDRALPELRWFASPMTEPLMRRPSSLTDRFLVAANRVVAVAPQETLTEIEEAGELLESWPGTSDVEWEARWNAFRTRLQMHIRELAGAERPPDAERAAA